MTTECKKCGKKMNIPKGHADLCYDCNDKNMMKEPPILKNAKDSLKKVIDDSTDIKDLFGSLEIMKFSILAGTLASIKAKNDKD